MKTLTRYMLLAVGGLLVLLVAAAVAISLFVDPNDYREEIVGALSEQTGRQVSLDGEVGLGVFPCCSLELGRIAIGNPEGWSEDQFLEADSVDVSIKLWPMLTSGELQIGQVALDGLNVNLIVRKNGAVNWEFPDTDTAGASGDAARADSEASPSAADRLAIEGIRVVDASVQYFDQQSGDRLELADVQLTTGSIAPGRAAKIALALIARGLLPEQPVELELDGKLLLGADGNNAELNDLDIQLDQTKITGDVRLTDIEALAVSFDLSVDRLDADRYLGDSDEPDAANDTAGDINETSVEIPVQTLRDLSMNGSVNIGELTFADARLTDMEITVAAEEGQLRLHPLTANLYDGAYAGDVRLNVRGAQPRLSVNEALSGVDIASLLTDTTGSANLSGIGNITIKGTAGGDTIGELLEQLRGDAGFNLDSGIYHGLDLWYEIRNARARLKKVAGPEKPVDPQTELREFSGTLQFANGKMTSRDFKAAVPFIQLTGSGDIDLLTSTIDYRLKARVVETPTFDVGPSMSEGTVEGEENSQVEELDKLTGLTIPVRLTGTAEDPKVKVDLGELAKDTAKKAVKDKVRDKLKEKFGLFD